MKQNDIIGMAREAGFEIGSVTGIKSNNGVLHGYVARYIGQCGTVKREAKNGMLLVYFKNSKNAKHRAIPAGCLTLYSSARIAGVKLK